MGIPQWAWLLVLCVVVSVVMHVCVCVCVCVGSVGSMGVCHTLPHSILYWKALFGHCFCLPYLLIGFSFICFIFIFSFFVLFIFFFLSI